MGKTFNRYEKVLSMLPDTLEWSRAQDVSEPSKCLLEPDGLHIERFVEAQEHPWAGYEIALAEISQGRKMSHWIWYIFPQLRGLGHSRYSHYYGIADRKGAEAYLAHPVLGPRLREISQALLANTNKSARAILGDIDAQKVKSCMTLFDSISPNDIFAEVLDSFYNGERDKMSIV